MSELYPVTGPTNEWFVYMVRCSDDSYYIGSTTDIQRRISEHNNGTGAKYTKGRRPVLLVLESGPLNDRSMAQSIESSLKSLSHKGKENLLTLWRSREGSKSTIS